MCLSVPPCLLLVTTSSFSSRNSVPWSGWATRFCTQSELQCLGTLCPASQRGRVSAAGVSRVLALSESTALSVKAMQCVCWGRHRAAWCQGQRLGASYPVHLVFMFITVWSLLGQMRRCPAWAPDAALPGRWAPGPALPGQVAFILRALEELHFAIPQTFYWRI